MNTEFIQLREALTELEDACQEGGKAFHFQRLSSLLHRAENRSQKIQERLLPELQARMTDLQTLLAKSKESQDETEVAVSAQSSVFTALIERINSFDVTAIEQSSLGLDALLFDEGFDQALDVKPSGGTEEKLSAKQGANDFQARAKELKSLQFYREQLGKVITENMVRQVIKEDPENAGPLNPQRLLVRAIGSMKELSPAYVNRLVPYYDTLLWLEQAGEQPGHKSPAKKPNSK